MIVTPDDLRRLLREQRALVAENARLVAEARATGSPYLPMLQAYEMAGRDALDALEALAAADTTERIR